MCYLVHDLVPNIKDVEKNNIGILVFGYKILKKKIIYIWVAKSDRVAKYNNCVGKSSKKS